MIFPCDFTTHPARMRGRSAETIRREPMFFSADAHFAGRVGGELTQEFLSYVGGYGPGWVIDSRVHMLMAGWYPCIPGWHHDDVPRDRPDGQPDYLTTSYKADHFMAIVDAGTGSFTEFLAEPVELEIPPEGRVIYRDWDDDIRARPLLKRHTVENLSVTRFSWQAFHRGAPAVSDGWRWFIRATRSSRRPVLNELRTQVQVYMPTVTAGW